MNKKTEVEEILEPTTGKRRYYAGFYDRAAKHGAITGSGPNFDKAMKAFNKRQYEQGRVGKWLHGKSDGYTYKHDDGVHVDIDYEIKEWL